MSKASKSSSTPSKAKPPKKERGFFSVLIMTFSAALAFRMIGFEPFEIKGPSMEPTLLNGDRILVSKFPYGLTVDALGYALPGMQEALFTWGVPDPGDVVIVNSPADNQSIVKRVVGVPGDTIRVEDGLIFRNGKPVGHREVGGCERDNQLSFDADCTIFEEKLQGERYQVSHAPDWCEGFSGRGCRATEFKVPDGRVYIRGDHRDHSNDSTNPMIGLVPISRLRGRAEFVYLSCQTNWAILCAPSEMRSGRFGVGL